MQNNSKIINTLIETIEGINSLTIWYFSLLKNTDCYKNFEINGETINNLYWLMAHLANSEDLLLLKTFGQKGHQLEWLKEFKLGSANNIESPVSFKELVEISKQTHKECISFLKTLTDSDLEKENVLGFEFSGDKSLKMMLVHHIRHIGIHTGHLSMLCKLNGIQTI